MWHQNTAKHKAMHGGYRTKPTKGQITATLSLYSGVAPLPKKREIKDGTQLHLFDKRFA
jgi:hypothetical protein